MENNSKTHKIKATMRNGLEESTSPAICVTAIKLEVMSGEPLWEGFLGGNK